MIYLLDTQILLWSVFQSRSLSRAARDLLNDGANDFAFSTTSVWEVAIKLAKRPDVFAASPIVFRTTLLGIGYAELLLTSEHAIALLSCPCSIVIRSIAFWLRRRLSKISLLRRLTSR